MTRRFERYWRNQLVRIKERAERNDSQKDTRRSVLPKDNTRRRIMPATAQLSKLVARHLAGNTRALRWHGNIRRAPRRATRHGPPPSRPPSSGAHRMSGPTRCPCPDAGSPPGQASSVMGMGTSFCPTFDGPNSSRSAANVAVTEERTSVSCEMSSDKFSMTGAVAGMIPPACVVFQ